MLFSTWPSIHQSIPTYPRITTRNNRSAKSDSHTFVLTHTQTISTLACENDVHNDYRTHCTRAFQQLSLRLTLFAGNQSVSSHPECQVNVHLLYECNIVKFPVNFKWSLHEGLTKECPLIGCHHCLHWIDIWLWYPVW